MVCQLHPFLPFETEEIFSYLSNRSLLTTNYFTSQPELRVENIDKELIEQVENHMLMFTMFEAYRSSVVI